MNPPLISLTHFAQVSLSLGDFKDKLAANRVTELDHLIVMARSDKGECEPNINI